MNKKAILLVSMILGLVLVPLVIAAPSLAQNQNGDTLQTRDQDQLQTRDCDNSCIQQGTGVNECLQNETCTQDQQCLQARDCNNTCTSICSNGCNGTQTQTRQRQCQQERTQTGNQQNRYGYQHQCRNQAP
jgi:hypothetical protein